MPRLDGFQLIARIRRESTLRGLPIVVLSSRTSQAARDKAIAARANVFLPKSRHRRSVVAAVDACWAEPASTSCVFSSAAKSSPSSPPRAMAR
jgi:DNA-binding response OmpR family regulator